MKVTFIALFLLLNVTCKKNNAVVTVPASEIQLRANEGLFYYNDLPFTGAAISFYPNKVKASIDKYRDGLPHGIQRKWFDTGILSFERNYDTGKIHGFVYSWWKNGEKRSTSYYKNGIGQGDQWQWYPNGAKFKKVHLVDGRESGMQQSWRNNGKLYNNYEVVGNRIYGLKRSQLCFELDDEKIKTKK